MGEGEEGLEEERGGDEDGRDAGNDEAGGAAEGAHCLHGILESAEEPEFGPLIISQMGTCIV
jgi:hypothetical protein